MKLAAKAVTIIGFILQFCVTTCLSKKIWITSMYDHYTINNDGVNIGNLTTRLRPQPPIKCSQISGLARKQREICRNHSTIMSSIAVGAVQALRECQVQFKLNRWNCRTHSPHVILNQVLQKNNREAAFLYAISSASVAHAVTRSCSRGELKSCGCDRSEYNHPMKKGYSWSGCSDNIHFGKAYSKVFVDATESELRTSKRRSNGVFRKVVKKKSKAHMKLTRKVVNLHNNEVGRQVLESLMKVECKCHGVSGSCELRTCWRALPNFHSVGKELKNKFSAAHLVMYSSTRLLISDSRTTDSQVASSQDLVYITHSPNYCTTLLQQGSYGTRGRQCNVTAGSLNSCAELCCGRGYETKLEQVQERCQCKFIWCCKVECLTCLKSQLITRCT